MRKLYTQYSSAESNTPFMVTFEGNQIQACANDADVVTIGSTEYVRVTDGQGHNVKAVIPNSGDEKAHQLIIRLGEGTTHDICYIEDDGVASSTSIQVIDIQPTPQETVITYTRSGTSSEYIADTQMVGTVPANAYLTWEMVDRPTTNINMSDYKVEYKCSVETTYFLAYGLSETADIPIKVGNPNQEFEVVARLQGNSDNGELLECIKRVTHKQLGCDIEIENISTGETRIVSNPSIAAFRLFVSELNQTEGDAAIQHLGAYLDFTFRNVNWEAVEKTPTVQLHIPQT